MDTLPHHQLRPESAARLCLSAVARAQPIVVHGGELRARRSRCGYARSGGRRSGADRHAATGNRRPDRPPAAHPSFSRERAGWPANDSGNRRRRRTAGTSETMDHLRGARGGGGTEPSRQRRLRLSIGSVGFFLRPVVVTSRRGQPIDELVILHASDPTYKTHAWLTMLHVD